jgi:CheY-like chemotaxis protein
VLVALTGHGQPEDRQRAAEAGFDAHLTKPVDLDALRTLLTTKMRVGAEGGGGTPSGGSAEAGAP